MPKRSMRLLTVGAAVLCVVALAIVATVLIQRKRAALAEAPRYGLDPTPVRVEAARQGSLEITRGYLAVVTPARTANIAARLISRVESVEVDEGHLVRANALLIRLDDQEIAHTIDVAEAELAKADAELKANEATVEALAKSAAYWSREAERIKELLSNDAASQTEMDAATDKVDQFTGQLAAANHKSVALKQLAKALHHRVAELRTRRGYCVLTSPFDGVVAGRAVDPGDQAAPDRTLLVIEDQSRLKLAFDIPQSDLPGMQEGMTVRFLSAAGVREARVTNLFPSLNQARMVRAEVTVEAEQAEGLNCGAYVPVTVVLDTRRNVTLVSAAALIEAPDGRSHVFTVVDGKLRPVEVTALGRQGSESAIEGVQPGTDVVLSTFLGWSRLSSGLAVEAIR